MPVQVGVDRAAADIARGLDAGIPAAPGGDHTNLVMNPLTDQTLPGILADVGRQLKVVDIVRLTRGQWNTVEAVVNPPREIDRLRAELEKL